MMYTIGIVAFFIHIETKLYTKKKKKLWPFSMDGVQLPHSYSHFEEAIYFLPFSSQKFLVLNLSTSEGWKAELTMEPSSGFEHRTPGLESSALTTRPLLHRIVL